MRRYPEKVLRQVEITMLVDVLFVDHPDGRQITGVIRSEKCDGVVVLNDLLKAKGLMEQVEEIIDDTKEDWELA